MELRHGVVVSLLALAELGSVVGQSLCEEEVKALERTVVARAEVIGHRSG